MKLAIISHTKHYYKDGNLVGWGPTIAEINHLSPHFEEIWHIAVLHEVEASPSALPYVTDRIHFIPLKPSGGPGTQDKIKVLFNIPSVIQTVSRILRKVDCWQFRAPTGIGVFLIPYLTLFTQKDGWFKYAGNWIQHNPPPGYYWQRLWLSKLQKRKVTINGNWPDQPAHCLSFENPCLTESDRVEGWKVISQKSYNLPLKACFVGRVEEEKGIGRLIHALGETSGVNIFCELIVIGTGKDEKKSRELAKKLKVPARFLGALPRKEVFKVYKECHLIILPSTASEGFPKVLAEAANFGCIPMASTVASIPQYIREGKEGFLWDYESVSFNEWLDKTNELLGTSDLKKMAETAFEFAGQFTFEHYFRRIQNEILN